MFHCPWKNPPAPSYVLNVPAAATGKYNYSEPAVYSKRGAEKATKGNQYLSKTLQ